MSDRLTMVVTMRVTVPQALALQAMFEYWNTLGSIGASREVAFNVDGDGNFHPRCSVAFHEDIPHLTPELREKAVARDRNGDRLYDFDAIAWRLRADRDERPAYPDDSVEHETAGHLDEWTGA